MARQPNLPGTICFLAISAILMPACATSAQHTNPHTPNKDAHHAQKSPHTTSEHNTRRDEQPKEEPLDWRALESAMLTDHAQLTFPDQFVKAGEQYFSPDARWMIFQAVPVPPEGEDPSPHYSMYVAKLVHDETTGNITRITDVQRISPDGSANTCGFFHPTQPGKVIFGSTLLPPKPGDQPGYQRASGRYRWAFPKEMDVTTVIAPGPYADQATKDDAMTCILGAPPAPLFERPNRYDAECAYSPDGRHVIFASIMEDNTADLFVYDTKTRTTRALITAPGYDGGPFFSPDGTKICYRSDRQGNNMLQLFIAELDITPDGSIVGVTKEHQLTNNQHVNWAPFWHPSGDFLIYATSEVGHHNYEVFSIKATLNTPPDQLRPHRITHANGFDGLPVFSPDGQWMMWTSQRSNTPGEHASSQVWIARVNTQEIKP